MPWDFIENVMEVIGNPYEILRNPFSGIPKYPLIIHWESLGIQLESLGTPKESKESL